LKCPTQTSILAWECSGNYLEVSPAAKNSDPLSIIAGRSLVLTAATLDHGFRPLDGHPVRVKSHPALVAILLKEEAGVSVSLHSSTGLLRKDLAPAHPRSWRPCGIVPHLEDAISGLDTTIGRTLKKTVSSAPSYAQTSRKTWSIWLQVCEERREPTWEHLQSVQVELQI
jgi:hypothetical protein